MVPSVGYSGSQFYKMLGSFIVPDLCQSGPRQVTMRTVEFTRQRHGLKSKPPRGLSQSPLAPGWAAVAERSPWCLQNRWESAQWDFLKTSVQAAGGRLLEGW